MQADSWDEMRTALHVARAGTVSGAAVSLGVHHATVIRHVDALEARLGVKLFQRHARGYTLTEAGADLLRAAGSAEEQLQALVGRLRGRSGAISGELVITAVSGFVGVLTPVLARFQEQNPDITIRFLSDSRLFRLDYGEAHVAIRAGRQPQEADNIVQYLATMRPRLCASRDYAARFGLPSGPCEFAAHRFVGGASENPRAPASVWLRALVPPERFVFRANEFAAVEAAVRAGIGIGFAVGPGGRLPDGLVEVMPPLPDWQSDMWLVTHVDLHRAPKVQAFTRFLKDELRNFEGATQ